MEIFFAIRNQRLASVIDQHQQGKTYHIDDWSGKGENNSPKRPSAGILVEIRLYGGKHTR